MEFSKTKQSQEAFVPHLEKEVTTVIKCLILFKQPIVVATLVTLVWHFFLHKYNLNCGDRGQEIVTNAVIPVIGIFYTIVFAGFAGGSVWAEYKSMREAAKRYDIDTFMDLRDETLIYLVMTVASVAMMAGFLSLNYATTRLGIVINFSVTFFLVLMYVVVREIDDPCSGLWFIKGLPKEWLNIDPKVYREKRCAEKRLAFMKEYCETPAADPTPKT